MRVSNLAPAKPEYSYHASAAQALLPTRRSLVLYALLSLTVIALHPAVSMAAERAEVKKVATTTQLKVSATTIAPGKTLTMTANVLPLKATGTVTAYGALKASGPFEKIKTVTVKNGIATGSEPIPKGIKGVTIWLKAVYIGSGTYASSSSNIVKVVVK